MTPLVPSLTFPPPPPLYHDVTHLGGLLVLLRCLVGVSTVGELS